MITALGALPVLLAAVLLLAGRGTAVAALSGVLCAGLLIGIGPLLGAPFSLGQLPAAQTQGLAVLGVEVLGILLFGMILARLLDALGALSTIAGRITAVLPDPNVGAALVVFGIVPFVESVTGYGIGLTAGIPLLRRLGFSLRTSAFLGLTGLIAVPWGALGPGTAVAAQLSGLTLTDLGVASARANALPVVVVTVLLIIITRAWRRLLGLVAAVLAGACLWVGVLTVNTVIGTPLAGVLGSLFVILVLLGACRLLPRSARTPGPEAAAGGDDEGADMRGSGTEEPTGRIGLGAALLPYSVLTVGLLAMSQLAGEDPGILLAVLATPAVWLGIACLVAGVMLARRSPAAEVVRGAARAWVPVGLATAGFMLLGWLMTDSGMTGMIGEAFARIGVGFAPMLNALASILTGSNTGANAMFAATVTAMGSATGTPVISAVAWSNVAGSFAALATPPRVTLAVTLGLRSTDELSSEEFRRQERTVLSGALLTAVITAALCGLALQLGF